MGNDRESYLLNVLEELVNNFAPKRSFVTRIPPGKVIVEALDGIVRRQGAEDSQRLCLESAMDAPMQEILDEVGDKLRVWLLGLPNAREHRLGGALAMADQLAEHLRDIGRQAGEAAQSLIKPMQSLKEALLGDPKAGKNWLQFRGYFSKRRLVVDRGLAEYFELCLHELVLNAFCRLARKALVLVSAVRDKLRNVVVDLHRIFPPAPATASDGDAPRSRVKAAQQAAAQQIAVNKAELLDEMESALESDLRCLVTTEADSRRLALAQAIRTAASAVVHRKLRQVAHDALSASLQGCVNDPLFDIPAALQAAVPPRFEMCGGRQRLLVVAPEPLAPAITPETLGEAVTALPTIVADPHADMLICYEVEGLTMPRIASAVLDQRFQIVEAASRLHTRTDVPWTPL
jgi:hypothetical protein